MILKRLPSYNVAVARLLRRQPDNNDALTDFVVRFNGALEGSPPPGLHLERIDTAKSPDVWSARAGRDLRVVMRKRASSWYAAHVGHHDEAYAWASSRTIDLPKTRAANEDDVNAVADVLESHTPHADPATDSELQESSLAFDAFDDQALEDFGVPHAMVPMLRKVTTAEQFIDVVSPQIPEELADRLLGAITEDFRAAYDGLVRAEEQSATPEESALLPARSPKLDKAVHRALASRPETSWAALADAQQLMIAQGSFDGPVLVTGAAGTGKSVVGLHRARHLAESGRHVRLTTYTNSLCDYLRRQLDSACSKRARSRISVDTVDRTAFYICGLPDLHGLDESERFDAMAMKAAALVVEGGVDIAFDALVVDEVQDLGPARLAFLQALIESGCNDAMLLADSSQRIYGEPFDLEDLGFDFAGREFHLETAYRTTQEIMDLASSVVVCEANDARPPIAYASGPAPRLLEFKDRETEVAWVSLEILRLVLREQVPSERIAVLARRNSSLRRYRGHLYHEFSLSTYGDDAIVQLMTMHAAKGLEFDAVFVVDVSDGEVPSGPALADGHASGCAQDALVRERNVLHTAVSRACDRVYVTWAGSPSSLLEPALAASGGPEHAGVSEHDEFVEWLETHEEA